MLKLTTDFSFASWQDAIEVYKMCIRDSPNSLEVLYEIQQVAVLMKFELEKGNIDGFAALLDRHWELSRRLDGGSTNTCIDQIFLSCEDLLLSLIHI